ncbi:hypothetical protein VTJ04DRAFT_9236 [Mycothermus thermophilus]|uniref:uncharacterized protein n=1 Tax=Humicola insolens TaxID=85995 RepID=UPI0037422677
MARALLGWTGPGRVRPAKVLSGNPPFDVTWTFSRLPFLSRARLALALRASQQRSCGQLGLEVHHLRTLG